MSRNRITLFEKKQPRMGCLVNTWAMVCVLKEDKVGPDGTRQGRTHKHRIRLHMGTKGHRKTGTQKDGTGRDGMGHEKGGHRTHDAGHRTGHWKKCVCRMTPNTQQRTHHDETTKHGTWQDKAGQASQGQDVVENANCSKAFEN